MNKLEVNVKRFLVAILLCFAVSTANANDMHAVVTITIAAVDTAAGAVVADTAFSGEIDIRGFRYLQFYSSIDTILNSGLMLNYTNDTFFVDLQTSADRIVWTDIHEVDTFLTGGTSFSPLNLDADATVFGNWIRCRFIYLGDALAADQPDSLGNVRAARAKLWVMPKGGSN